MYEDFERYDDKTLATWGAKLQFLYQRFSYMKAEHKIAVRGGKRVCGKCSREAGHWRDKLVPWPCEKAIKNAQASGHLLCPKCGNFTQGVCPHCQPEEPMGKLEGWEKDGCHYAFTEGPPRQITVKNSSEDHKSIEGKYLLAPGEAFTSQSAWWINTLLKNKPETTSQPIKDAIEKAGEELKEKAEYKCNECNAMVPSGGWPFCPHTGEGKHAAEAIEKAKKSNYYKIEETDKTTITITATADLKAGDMIYIDGASVTPGQVAGKQIPPAEKPKGRFIKLK